MWRLAKALALNSAAHRKASSSELWYSRWLSIMSFLV
jgi:hypothetical protein